VNIANHQHAQCDSYEPNFRIITICNYASIRRIKMEYLTEIDIQNVSSTTTPQQELCFKDSSVRDRHSGAAVASKMGVIRSSAVRGQEMQSTPSHIDMGKS
jgi:hypothetical protein